ncbi:hypothetical protein Dda_0215 [Drechslerella dactyloides]|uniref:Uncharacterized protein n=1 Tax=Drechslerella dactyloides TaxID=74499 RepID=A0AAD6J3X9_DREDA|nr:hypothetical protein Dda_0215 [Drechslerella dactyloides]
MSENRRITRAAAARMNEFSSQDIESSSTSSPSSTITKKNTKKEALIDEALLPPASQNPQASTTTTAPSRGFSQQQTAQSVASAGIVSQQHEGTMAPSPVLPPTSEPEAVATTTSDAFPPLFAQVPPGTQLTDEDCPGEADWWSLPVPQPVRALNQESATFMTDLLNADDDVLDATIAADADIFPPLPPMQREPETVTFDVSNLPPSPPRNAAVAATASVAAEGPGTDAQFNFTYEHPDGPYLLFLTPAQILERRDAEQRAYEEYQGRARAVAAAAAAERARMTAEYTAARERIGARAAALRTRLEAAARLREQQAGEAARERIRAYMHEQAHLRAVEQRFAEAKEEEEMGATAGTGAAEQAPIAAPAATVLPPGCAAASTRSAAEQAAANARWMEEMAEEVRRQ